MSLLILNKEVENVMKKIIIKEINKKNMFQYCDRIENLIVDGGN